MREEEGERSLDRARDIKYEWFMSKRDLWSARFLTNVWYLNSLLKVEFLQYLFAVDTRTDLFSRLYNSRDLNAWLDVEREQVVALSYSRKWNYAKYKRKSELVTALIHILKEIPPHFFFHLLIRSKLKRITWRNESKSCTESWLYFGYSVTVSLLFFLRLFLIQDWHREFLLCLNMVIKFFNNFNGENLLMESKFMLEMVVKLFKGSGLTFIKFYNFKT